MTVIPAATVRGGGGGGMGDHEGADSGGGGGFGLTARPSGAWIVEDGRATWKPAVDVNRIVLGGQAIALTAILVTGRILLAHTRRRRSLLELVPDLRHVAHVFAAAPAEPPPVGAGGQAEPFGSRRLKSGSVSTLSARRRSVRTSPRRSVSPSAS